VVTHLRLQVAQSGIAEDQDTDARPEERPHIA
jgi:hypothetical protein